MRVVAMHWSRADATVVYEELVPLLRELDIPDRFGISASSITISVNCLPNMKKRI